MEWFEMGNDRIGVVSQPDGGTSPVAELANYSISATVQLVADSYWVIAARGVSGKAFLREKPQLCYSLLWCRSEERYNAGG